MSSYILYIFSIPIIVISLVGMFAEMIAILRLAVTRDDVWYTKGSAACEFVETRRGYQVPIRKLVVFNQKYENPQGLLDALQGDVDGPVHCPPGDKCDNEKNGVSMKALAGHAVIGLSALCAMLVL